jgi:murein DD-endopeptidase MepM/ murein hydrolase activator NlpD
MTRATVAAGLVLAFLGAASASGADGRGTFVVVETSAGVLPSAEEPNAPGSVALPPDFTVRASQPASLSFAELQSLWQRAGAAYGIPWQVLAAINKIESNFGQNMGPSSAGAVGWMQFMPETWLRWGLDASGDGVADPWNPYDGVYAAARYLAAAGGRTDLYRGVFAYNHADWYVEDVLELAQVYARGGLDVSFSVGGPALDDANAALGELRAELEASVIAQKRLSRVEARLVARVARARLLSDRLAWQKQAVLAGVRREGAAAETERLRDELAATEARLAQGAWPSAVPSSTLFLTPSADGAVFPVGGGASVVSVSRDHHDYPAADIAAPLGSPVYAHARVTVRAAWTADTGRCGIGAQLLTGDGRAWTYCHLAYLEPSVRPGAQLEAGTPLGAIGMTGRTTGPHLHLQLDPAGAYPQAEPWFQHFAGTAFRWQGEPAPSAQAPVRPVHPVFAVVDDPADDVVRFSR